MPTLSYRRARWWALALALLPVGALAADPLGTVLRIEGPDVFVDLGRAQGVETGSKLKLLREIQATHPATGKTYVDRFLIGEVTVAEAGEVLSRIRLSPELLPRTEVGDRVLSPDATLAVVESVPPPPKPPAQGQAPAGNDKAATAAVQAQLGELSSAWRRAISLPPRDRAAVWERYLKDNPGSPVREPLLAEIAHLRQVAESADRQKAAEVMPAANTQVAAPTRALEDDPVEVVAAIGEGLGARAGMLHWRTRGQPTYRTVHMTTDDDQSHFRATVPPEGAVEPGVEYFVEVVTPAGTPTIVTGGPTEPQPITVTLPPGKRKPLTVDRSRVRVHSEYVDFNRFKNNDTYFLVEGDFLYRVMTALHSVRVGYGVYQGRGTPKVYLDDTTGDFTVPVGYSYGFAELEFRLHPIFAVMARGITGVTQEGLRLGAEGRMRIGEETGISLTVGAAATDRIGQKANIALAWDAVQGWPMIAEVQVTNEPIGADLGVRLLYTLGRRITPWLDVQGRVGYQLRDIQHAGFSFGLGANFHW